MWAEDQKNVIKKLKYLLIYINNYIVKFYCIP